MQKGKHNQVEELLLKRAKNGDASAFEELVVGCEKKIYSAAYRFMGNHFDAGDVVQEALIKAYQALPGFRGDSSFSTWLLHIVANVSRDELRRRRRAPITSLDAPSPGNGGELPRPAVDQSAGPDAAYEAKESGEFIQKLIDSLPVEYRLTLVMRDIQGFSYEEIAQQLECSVGTVKSRLNRARSILRKKMAARG